MTFEDKRAALSGSATCSFHADAIAASKNFRERYATLPNVVKAEEMPWERSPRRPDQASRASSAQHA
jgi:hypothetical protein